MPSLSCLKKSRYMLCSPAVYQGLQQHELCRGFAAPYIGHTVDDGATATARPSGAAETIFMATIHGTGSFQIGGKRGEVKKNGVLLIPAGTPHAYWCGKKGWSYYWAHLRGTEVATILKGYGTSSPMLSVTAERFEQIEAQFEAVLKEVATNRSVERMVIASQYLRGIFSMALLDQKHHRRQGGRLASHQAIEQSLRFLSENTHRFITLKEVADVVGLSPSRFANLFKTQTGTSPMAHHMHLRVQKAAGLIASSNMRMQEIAAGVGFDDPYYFSRAFKNHLQVSPMSYRRRLRSGQE